MSRFATCAGPMAVLSLACSVWLGGCSCEAIVATDDGGARDSSIPDAPDSAFPPTDAGPEVDASAPDASPLADTGPTPDGGIECADEDSDGVTVCDGDCDDDDPLTFPGAPEVCGDGVDNACGANPDPVARCAGIGTYVSLAGSDTTGDGTPANPVRTIARGIVNAGVIGAPTTVIVAGGTYDETVTLVDGVSIQGGFECAALPCAWGHDPSAHETVVDGGATANAMDADLTVTRATRVEDVTLRSERTGIAMVSGSPVLRHCRIEARSGVVAYGAGSDPRIDACTVVTSSTGVSLGNGGELVDSDVEGAPAISAGGPSLVQHNVVHASGDTGIFLGGDTRVDGNRVNEDASRVGTCSFGFCAGIAIWGGSPVITNNVVYGMGGMQSAAISIVHGELLVDRPRVHSNTLYVSRTPGGAGSLNVGVSCISLLGIAMFGELRNNLVIGAGPGTSYGFYEEDHADGERCRPVLIENNAFFDIDHVARFFDTPETLFTTVTDANAESWAAANLTTDPMLDAEHRLSAGSGCIDQGTATEAPTVDRDGDARPTGGGYDIGADERR